jgi:hypothetical protein
VWEGFHSGTDTEEEEKNEEMIATEEVIQEEIHRKEETKENKADSHRGTAYTKALGVVGAADWEQTTGAYEEHPVTDITAKTNANTTTSNANTTTRIT